jgi:EmrB/QacA subfamily drug resistance transporter
LEASARTSAPALEDHGVNRWIVLALVCVAQFMVVLDATITNVALRVIQNALTFSDADLQWIITAYTLMFGGFLLLGGRAADLFGRRTLFVAGLVLFTGASLVNGLAGSSGVLIGGRAVQGLGAALVSPAALAIVMTTFAEGRDRTKALGIWSAIAAGGGAVGLLLGGFLTEDLSWRWVFFINLPIGIAAVLLAFRILNNTKAAERPATADVAGAVTVTGGLLLLVYGIVKAPKTPPPAASGYGWVSWQTFAFIGVAILLLAAFVAIEKRSKAPLIRLDLFRIRSLAGSNAAMLLAAGGLFSMFYFATLYLQKTLDYSPIQAGLAFLPVTGCIVIAAGIAQTAIPKLGVRVLSLIGMVLAAGGLFYLSRIPLHGHYWPDVLPGIIVMSLGMGFTFVPVTLIATTNIDAGDAGLASGIFNTSQQVGGAVGLAVLSTFFINTATHYVGAHGGRQASAVAQAQASVNGYSVAFAIGACFMLAAAVLIALLVRKEDVAQIAESPAAVVA